ncbi:preprotein translocase subunit SecA [Acinetobacter junii]|jgi:preprotein translocase subunit SecA|uniref:Protein translocase subunit SecA n=1 Tax=Acinetobacter junii CIP 107470 = MTCC 11364 TaxID=1217666 RepID=S7Y6A3_ACIJU|nr:MULTISPECIES: preprotein translocase subunit SecA [Acinetobacter]ATU46202.1 preprotein translocase subunit SecA [Acinetobacter junii]ENV51723.1 protein translocase subunit secA [Acinetobacter junii CIP 107470 = MTCC 11364]ENV66065.1 protein translocase subunit secA [Acinetobacter junii CIP 64.5]EPR83523.1 Protein export cytoplasm protein SecA ATPase RNA helicase [Acinetobacter junii CIP 107470 = MTCC 11364]MBL8281229.1 preprotein translocase subunit SecA [Acinetobacter junii]
MLASLIGGIFGTKNERELKRMRKIVEQINALEPTISALNDADLSAKTQEFKERFKNGESLNKLLPEAFAVCREAAKRVMGMRHYDVQLIGGITLHEGKIAEMRTGEGKTLMGTLACYLNALSGQGVHVITVNDYLAQRDAELNRPLFEFLGLSIGVIYSMQMPAEKAQAYLADITYGTNNEFGFDYLRDNMVFSLQEKKQRGLSYAIIDEVDSILIDEARTPLIISGQSEDSSHLYQLINSIPPTLKPQKEEKVADGGHFWVDEKQRSVEMTEVGYETVEQELIRMGLLAEGESLYSAANLNLVHHVTAAIRAHYLYQKNVHYIIGINPQTQKEEVIIVDESTGRTMPGRRWSEGLHQAVEAKENMEIQPENQTLATTTFQNYFRLYKKLSGMTGTADTEAAEMKEIYGLDVVIIPTHRPMVRKDHNDLIYLNRNGKYNAIIEEITNIRKQGVAPILIGTATIEASEILSAKLLQAGIQHEVLNAKQHEREADIIAQAGSPNAVTIATNMAGRGTDILLGGNWKAKLAKIENPTPEDEARLQAQWEKDHEDVLNSGGLHIIGSERHESRRIDNQLRGRAGRQGDPGVSRFYLSLEDDLMRIFAGDRVVAMMRAMGLQENEAIEHKMVSRSIENAQRKVEARNFDIRKNLLKYDDVNNEQRKIIYSQRDEILAESTLQDYIEEMHKEVMKGVIANFIPPESIHDQWDIPGLETALRTDLGIELPVQQWLDQDRRLDEEGLIARISDEVISRYRQRRTQMGDESAAMLERHFMLNSLDRHWKDHLAAMDYLRQGIHLRGYAQKNPEQEYKKEAFNLFVNMLGIIKSDVVTDLSRVHVPTAEELAELEAQQQRQAESMRLSFEHDDVDGLTGEVTASEEPEYTVNNAPFPVPESRNAPCPCGSGLKYKQCHGKI